MSKCTNCRHTIDDRSKLCPYCGADPVTGVRFDPKPLLEKHFPRKKQVGTVEAVLDYLRHRQSIVVGVAAVVALLLLLGLHSLIITRNSTLADASAGIPLTEVSDVNQGSQEEQVPMPALTFPYDGNPETMKVPITEPGAVAPAPPPGAPGGQQPLLPRREQGLPTPGTLELPPPTSSPAPFSSQPPRR